MNGYAAMAGIRMAACLIVGLAGGFVGLWLASSGGHWLGQHLAAALPDLSTSAKFRLTESVGSLCILAFMIVWAWGFRRVVRNIQAEFRDALTLDRS